MQFNEGKFFLGVGCIDKKPYKLILVWYQNCCFYICPNITASTYMLMLVQYKKNTGIVQNWQVRVVHFYIGTSVQISCCYIILLNQLFCLTDFFTTQGNSCLLMLVQSKVDFVRVPNYTVTVQNMSFSFGVLRHMNCQRMNKKHNIKLHLKKLGCSECTVNITHMYR